MSDKTTMWRSRVAAWRASGQMAAVYAAEQGFSVSALRSWSSRLRREERPSIAGPAIRLACVVRSATADTAARARAAEVFDSGVQVTPWQRRATIVMSHPEVCELSANGSVLAQLEVVAALRVSGTR
jgi:hypothetical protein